MALTAGTCLGPYEILGPIGAGGMGEVYRARDPRLRREVALKVLPPQHASDPQRLHRFESEARAVAALNHPHVLAVYDTGTDGGVSYVVFELLEGDTLRGLLRKGPLPARKVLDYGVQICQGLAAAHARSIVHRDLKPENLFLTADGHIKILDFGLASLHTARPGVEEASDSDVTTATTPGLAMGTPGYMSPEQVRGEAVDARSDIFSLGAVLYELLSGRRAFRGDSAQDTMRAILSEDPPPLSVASRAAPPALERILRRCLEKRLEDRFQSAHDLALALEAVSGVSPPLRLWLPKGTRSRGTLAVLAVAVFALVAGWLVVRRTGTSPGSPTLPPMKVVPVTSDDTLEYAVSLSPDGRLLAYERPDPDGAELVVQQLGGGQPLRVADDLRRGTELAWSPDGSRIAYYRHLDDGEHPARHEIVSVPALGGRPRPVATNHSQFHGLSWSPDGTLLAFNDREPGESQDHIVLFSVETGERRRLTDPPPEALLGDSRPRFSPDGQNLAFTRSREHMLSDLYVVATDGGPAIRLTIGNMNSYGYDWAPDGQSLVFATGRIPSLPGVYALWKVPVAGGEPQPVGIGEGASAVTVSRLGNRLAYVRSIWDEDIWRTGNPRKGNQATTAARFVFSSAPEWVTSGAYSPDGQKVAYFSYQSGPPEIWVADGDGHNATQLTFLEHLYTLTPCWSPDGRQIVFDSMKEGEHFDLYGVPSAGGVPRRLTSWPGDEGNCSWSRDGRWLYFASDRTGRKEIWRMPAQGGEAVQVTSNGASWAFESTDGRHLYFTKNYATGGPKGVWCMPVDGGEEVQVLDHVAFGEFAVAEGGLYFINRQTTPLPRVDFLDFASQEVSEVATLDPEPRPWTFAVSPDERWFLYSYQEMTSDIMLVENFR